MDNKSVCHRIGKSGGQVFFEIADLEELEAFPGAESDRI